MTHIICPWDEVVLFILPTVNLFGTSAVILVWRLCTEELQKVDLGRTSDQLLQID